MIVDTAHINIVRTYYCHSRHAIKLCNKTNKIVRKKHKYYDMAYEILSNLKFEKKFLTKYL